MKPIKSYFKMILFSDTKCKIYDWKDDKVFFYDEDHGMRTEGRDWLMRKKIML